MKPYDNCRSLVDLFRLASSPPVPSMLMQCWVIIHSGGWVIIHCIYGQHLYPSVEGHLGSFHDTSQPLTRIKRHIDNNTLIVGDLNTPFSAIDRSPKQKINKETRALNDILDQMDLIDIYSTLHPRTSEYSFFSNAHGTFSRIDHILGHKTGLNRYQKTEIIPCIFSDHNDLKLELNQRKNLEETLTLGN